MAVAWPSLIGGEVIYVDAVVSPRGRQTRSLAVLLLNLIEQWRVVASGGGRLNVASPPRECDAGVLRARH
ncbi:MAG TPA: hypothetical protein VE197_02100 [Mycobacterium sp.]|nr:hypothetical protein [Mycobacterium sp.]